MKKLLSINNIFKNGSSLPVEAEGTENEKYFVKLKGTGEGTIALISDFISSKLGSELGLPVLDPFFVYMDKDIKVNLKNDELYDLINSSYGINLGFPLIEYSSQYSEKYSVNLISQDTKDIIFLFDCFLLNIDRTHLNHDILVSGRSFYVLDYSASFIFRSILNNIKYGASPEIAGQLKRNIFYREGIKPEVLTNCFDLISDSQIQNTIDEIPDEWLLSFKEDAKIILKKEILNKLRDKNYLKDLLKLISDTEVESEESRIKRQLQNRENFENRFLKKK